MSTLIYSPGIRVHVQTSTGLLDLTEDIVSWEVNLQENAVHTFAFRLQNAQRKYDARMLPMDRIAVQLKRINWLQSFTGYLNDSPIFQAWPDTLDLSASCTLKVPQFWYWDPTSVEANSMVTSILAGGPGVFTSNESDNNMAKLITESLSRVTKWDKKRIHVGRIPSDWFKFAEKVGDRIETDSAIANLLKNGSVAGGTPTVKVPLPSGKYGPQKTDLDDVQAKNASIIYNTVRVSGQYSANTAIAALMCAYTESKFYNYANQYNPDSLALPHDRVGHDHASVGLFQQQVGGMPGSTANWGTTAELMNPVISTQKFLARFVTVRSSPHPDLGAMIQVVQGSAKPDAYAVWQDLATAIVTILDQKSTGAFSDNGLTTGAHIGGDTSADVGTGTMVAAEAIKLIKDHPPGHISYVFGEAGGDSRPDPLELDCSSLVDVVYYRATNGQHLPPAGAKRSNTHTIWPRCRMIPVDLALKIKGAALFVGTTAANSEHIGISLGDGNLHVAAHDHFPGHPEKEVDISAAGSQFNIGALLPSIDYSKSATDQATADAVGKLFPKGGLFVVGPTITDPNADPNAPTVTTGTAFDNLISNLVLGEIDLTGIGNVLPPKRSLMNDQPFLPWLANVCNSAMRSFCSAPNGDFIAWFPDYFGVWGTGAIMNIQPIELQNFVVKFSDQKMVTHEFVIGAPAGTGFDPTSGSVSFADPSGILDETALFLMTSGIATLEFPEIFEAIYGQQAPPAWTSDFLKRFGGRPNVDQVPNIREGKAEFFMALYLFMRYWAAMFSATIPLTFMPELWPGMVLRIPEFGFQCYVQGVTHTGSYGDGGGFRTEVSVCAPANIGGNSRMDLLSLLPLGGPR